MQTRNAFTLIELIVVLSILIALGGMVLPLYSDNLNSAAETVTLSTLSEARDGLLNYWQDTKLVKLDGVLSYASESQRFNIAWLFANPVTHDRTVQYDRNVRRGWNGPYLVSSTSDPLQPGSPNLVDGWGRVLAVQYVNPSDDLKDVRIVSAGPNGVVDIPPGVATSTLTSNSIGDDLYVALMLR